MKLNLDRQEMEAKYGDRIIIYRNSKDEEVPVKLKDIPAEDARLLLYNMIEKVEFTSEILNITEETANIRESRIETLQNTVKTLQEHVKLAEEQREEWYACWERSNELVYKLLIAVPILTVFATIGIVNLIVFVISMFVEQ